MTQTLRRRLLILIPTLAVSGAAVFWWSTISARAPLLFAPMIGGFDGCYLGTNGVAPTPQTVPSCAGAEGSAAQLVEDTLSALAPATGGTEWAELGYTLQIPLLKFFVPDGNDWAIDQEAVGRLVRTVRDTDRPVVLYFFATHFGIEAPIEYALAQDPDNLAHTPQGPLPLDRFHQTTVFPWSVARTDNSLTQRRVQAMNAVIDQLCALPDDAQARIRGTTLLGELHHLYPRFETGMGFDSPYLVSDYSTASRTGFRRYLAQRFGNVDTLNQKLGSSFISFEAVEPPGKDIRTETLKHYWEHFDAFAAGFFPVTGWVHAPGLAAAGTPHMAVYVNGVLQGRTPVSLSRQDVLAAHPELGTAEVGWRYDLDFRAWPTGVHRIDLFLEGADGSRWQFDAREVSVMDKAQRTPAARPMQTLPPSSPRPASLKGYVDQPAPQASVYFNPLAELWHAYRGRQVVDYLQHINGVFANTCLSDVPRYTHQIIPFTNPSWDVRRFAVEPSLERLDGMEMGISLYGEAAVGRSFLDWQEQRGMRPYGVTEFHPLRPMDPAALRQALESHHRQGAVFVSFFLEARHQDKLLQQLPNALSFDPQNAQHGSDVLYRSVRTLLQP